MGISSRTKFNILGIIFITIILFVLGAIFSSVSYAKGKKEAAYTREFCQPKGWEIKHRIMEGKKFVAEVDCLGPEYAVEVDFAPKYYEAVGQSLRYAVLTGQLPGIVLIVGPGDERYAARLREIIKGAFLPIKLWIVEK